MKVVPIAFSTVDNFSYLVLDETSKKCAVIDVSNQWEDVSKVLAKYPDYQLTKIFTTHKHMDHAGGNDVIYEQFPDVDIIGGTIDQVLCCRTCVNDGDVMTFGNLKVHILHTPGHTNGHICYFIPVQPGCDTPAVFTGDTLFIGGCGKFFEGTGAEMYNSLKKLTALPGNTEVYCGHEYTASNYRFALSVNPSNAALASANDTVMELRAQNKPTVPSTIQREIDTNPFLRTFDSEVVATVCPGAVDPCEILTAIREAKNNFK